MFPWCISNLSLNSLFLLLWKRWCYLCWYLYSLYFFVQFYLLRYFAFLRSLQLLFNYFILTSITLSSLLLLFISAVHYWYIFISFNVVFASFAALYHTRVSFLPKNSLLCVFLLLVFSYSSTKYFNSSSDISGHYPLLVLFLNDFIKGSIDPHA